MTWVAAAVGLGLGWLMVTVADRWCPRRATWRGKALGGGFLAVLWVVLVVRFCGWTSAVVIPRGLFSVADGVPVHAWGRLGAWWGFAVFATLAVGLVRVDWAMLRLPDLLVGSGYLLVLVPLLCADLGAWPRMLMSGALCVVGYGVLCAGGGLGFGDVKLGGLIGAALGWLSWSAVEVGVMVGLILGALQGLGHLWLGRVGRDRVFPFGPAMLLGALVAALVPNVDMDS